MDYIPKYFNKSTTTKKSLGLYSGQDYVNSYSIEPRQPQAWPEFKPKVFYNKAGFELTSTLRPQKTQEAYRIKDNIVDDSIINQLINPIIQNFEYRSEDDGYCLVEEVKGELPSIISRAYERSGLRNIKYIPDKFDCDDYAETAKVFVNLENLSIKKNRYSLCFGKIYARKSSSDAHMFNFYINTKGQLRLFEPQTGELEGSLWDYIEKGKDIRLSL